MVDQQLQHNTTKHSQPAVSLHHLCLTVLSFPLGKLPFKFQEFYYCNPVHSNVLGNLCFQSRGCDWSDVLPTARSTQTIMCWLSKCNFSVVHYMPFCHGNGWSLRLAEFPLYFSLKIPFLKCIICKLHDNSRFKTYLKYREQWFIFRLLNRQTVHSYICSFHAPLSHTKVVHESNILFCEGASCLLH